MLIAEMAKVRAIRTIIIGQMPPGERFTAADIAVLAQHKTFLAELGEPMIKSFCASQATESPPRTSGAAGPRPDLEATLRDFWHRLLAGPIDIRFWDWMTLVALAHIVRQVRTPMMIGAWSWIASFVAIEAAVRLPAQDVLKIQVAFGRLGTTLAALVSESYLKPYHFAVAEVAGVDQGLLQTVAEQLVGPAHSETRDGRDLGRSPSRWSRQPGGLPRPARRDRIGHNRPDA